MIEKNKRAVIGKLWTIQLIEVDLQLVMRIYINTRNKGKIENDPRVSKCNYSLRLKYSIETAILEKQLIYNTSTLNYKHIIYNITDLEAYFNRQLPNVGSIMQESIGIERDIIKLIYKILLIFKRYIYTSYSISEQYYGRVINLEGSTWQG